MRSNLSLRDAGCDVIRIHLDGSITLCPKVACVSRQRRKASRRVGNRPLFREELNIDYTSDNAQYALERRSYKQTLTWGLIVLFVMMRCPGENTFSAGRQSSAVPTAGVMRASSLIMGSCTCGTSIAVRPRQLTSWPGNLIRHSAFGCRWR